MTLAKPPKMHTLSPFDSDTFTLGGQDWDQETSGFPIPGTPTNTLSIPGNLQPMSVGRIREYGKDTSSSLWDLYWPSHFNGAAVGAEIGDIITASGGAVYVAIGVGQAYGDSGRQRIPVELRDR